MVLKNPTQELQDLKVTYVFGDTEIKVIGKELKTNYVCETTIRMNDWSFKCYLDMHVYQESVIVLKDFITRLKPNYKRYSDGWRYMDSQSTAFLF